LHNSHTDIDAQMLQARQMMERVFGFREFRTGQEEIVEAVFSGEDVLAVMPTGRANRSATSSRLWSCPAPAWSSPPLSLS
jgi:hypothetical protein